MLFDAATSIGHLVSDADCEFHPSSSWSEYLKVGFTPPHGSAIDVAFKWGDLGLPPTSAYAVQDVWTGDALGTHVGAFRALSIPFHGTAFLRLTPRAAIGPTAE